MKLGLMVKRTFDLLLDAMLLVLFSIPLLLVGISIKLTSPGPVLFWSKRVGRGKSHFDMPKFRTMKSGTPLVATHLLSNSAEYLTPIGSFLRKTSIDELPQLWSIFKGDMSFVGPRPALFNQDDLIALRKQAGIDRLKPGLTGWAQVNGRDDLPVLEKVRWDADYLKKQSFFFDVYILFLTVVKVLRREGISH